MMLNVNISKNLQGYTRWERQVHVTPSSALDNFIAVTNLKTVLRRALSLHIL